jgi:hypothetical protein
MSGSEYLLWLYGHFEKMTFFPPDPQAMATRHCGILIHAKKGGEQCWPEKNRTAAQNGTNRLKPSQNGTKRIKRHNFVPAQILRGEAFLPPFSAVKISWTKNRGHCLK